jgi:hypothetical protein
MIQKGQIMIEQAKLDGTQGNYSFLDFFQENMEKMSKMANNDEKRSNNDEKCQNRWKIRKKNYLLFFLGKYGKIYNFCLFSLNTLENVEKSRK